MSIDASNTKLNMKPGLKCNLNQARPKFTAAAKLGSAQPTSSALKQSASASIANAKNVSVFSSGARRTGGAFVPAARLVSANNYRLDRTTVTPWGSIQGDHYIEGQTGMTKRSYDRYMNQMGYSKYNTASSGGSSGSFWKALGIGVLGATAIGAGAVAVSAHNDGVSFGDKLKELFGSSKTKSTTVNKSSSEVKASGKDASSIRTAITLANSNKAALENGISQLEQQVNNTDAKAQYDTAKASVKNKKQEVETAKQQVKNSEQQVNGFKMKRDSAQAQLNSLNTAYAQTVEALTTAQTNLAQAEITLANTPEKIPDANGNQVSNPAYDTAKQAVATAKQEVETAKQQKEEAAKNVEGQKSVLKTIEDNINTAQEQMTTAMRNQANAEKELEKQQSELNKMETTIKNYEGDMKELASKKENLEKLEHNIQDLQADLQKAENREKKN